MTIRPATLADQEPIMLIWNALIRETSVTFNSIEKTPDEVATFIDENPVFVADADAGAVTGYASFGPFRNGVGYERIAEHSIVLTTQAQGHGTARALMEAIYAQARAQNITSLIAGISAENENGIGFHTHLGFEKVGHIPKAGYKFGRHIDLILMQKHL